MYNNDNIKMIIEAIDSVREQAQKAQEEGNLLLYRELMQNLLTLEVCLVGEVKKAIKVA